MRRVTQPNEKTATPDYSLVKIPKELAKRLRKEAIDREISLQRRVQALLDLGLEAEKRSVSVH